ncbi:MAG: biotin--[Clostridia bacterium]|nr:biotin--[acetyl-CoA-carboxylase] ligase [Clostridia bacterium]
MSKKEKVYALSEEKIASLSKSGIHVRVFDTIDSTNNEAKRMLESGHCGKAIVAAEAQTGGRGRLGRSFYSPAATGLYFTAVVPPCFPPECATLLTPAAAVAVTRVLERHFACELKIKWVNDIYKDDKKICGILAEAVPDMENGGFAGFAVGIGINLSTEDFPAEIAGIAASLGAAGADRNAIAAEIAAELFAFAEKLAAREFMPEYRGHSYVVGKKIYFTKGEEKQNAAVLGIDDDGGLMVKLENGDVTTLRGGEISVRIR